MEISSNKVRWFLMFDFAAKEILNTCKTSYEINVVADNKKETVRAAILLLFCLLVLISVSFSVTALFLNIDVNFYLTIFKYKISFFSVFLFLSLLLLISYLVSLKIIDNWKEKKILQLTPIPKTYQ